MTREERAREACAQAVEQLGGPARMSIAADIRADTSAKYYNVTMAAMLTFADDEAAAMRERAAKVAEEWAKENRAAEDQERRIGSASMADRLAGAAIEANALAAAIRALSTRGEG